MAYFLFRKYCGTYAVYQQKNAAELAEYIQSNILPDYDNFVKAGEQYNNDAVHINDIVVISIRCRLSSGRAF